MMLFFYLLFEFGSLVVERFQRSQKFLDFNFSCASKALKSHNFHRMRGRRWVSAMKWVHSWFDCWEMQQGFTFDNADFWFSIFKSYLHSKSFTPMKVKKVCFLLNFGQNWKRSSFFINISCATWVASQSLLESIWTLRSISSTSCILFRSFQQYWEDF